MCKVDTVFPRPCVATQTMATTPKPAQQPPVRVALVNDGGKIVSIFVLRLQSPIGLNCYDLGKIVLRYTHAEQPASTAISCCNSCLAVCSSRQAVSSSAAIEKLLCAFLHLIAKASSCSHCFGNAQDSEACDCLPFVILCTRHAEYLVW